MKCVFTSLWLKKLEKSFTRHKYHEQFIELNYFARYYDLKTSIEQKTCIFDSTFYYGEAN